MVVNSEIARLEKFSRQLRSEDREVFQDMMNQCLLYASHASAMASPVKEIPLLLSIIFGQHKMILNLERKCGQFGEVK